MDIKEKNELKNEIALFRYGLIAPVVTDTYEESSMESYFRNVSSKTYIINGKEEKFAPTTNEYSPQQATGYLSKAMLFLLLKFQI